MNAKKHRRMAHKLTQKVDRGGQNRRAVEGKSNITSKRVTLLPGFLINGFTSNTVQKTKALDNSRKKKNHLLTENIQAFLELKGKHPRRSQRILKKNFDHKSTNGSKTSSSNRCDNLDTTAKNFTSQASFKSILKNNSKSLFKDISDRFSKVNIHNSETVSQKPVVPTKENQNLKYLEEIGTHMNPQFLNQNRNENRQYMDQNHFEDLLPQPQNMYGIDLNRSFCRNLEKQITVTFKRNVVDECREKIRKEIKTVSLALQGRAEIEEMIVHDSQENQSGIEGDGPSTKFYPVPSQNWVYQTPPNQKIGVPQIDECQLKTGVLCQNKNQQNLYEVKPSFNINFSKLRHIENVSIDDRFMRKVAQVKKTPMNFGFKGYRSDGFQQHWRDPHGCGGSVELNGQKDSFVKPNFANIITRPVKLPRKQVFANYLEEHMPTPQVIQETTNQNFTGLQDFTFIEEGNDFKMQESQPVAQQRNKRKLSNEEFVIKRRNLFIAEPMNCDKSNMFNFGSQERNIFNFGKV